MMIYGYIRVSTDKQSVENQRFEIEQYCRKYNFNVSSWIEETISGTKQPKDRKLGKLLKDLNKDDILVCAELSRLGRNMFMIMSILNYCMENSIKVWTIKEGYKLGNDLTSKVLAFAFGLSAEIERELISQRTKEALARKKSEGITLGRPKGSKSAHYKLSGQECKIEELLDLGISKVQIAKQLGVNRNTLYRFLKNMEKSE